MNFLGKKGVLKGKRLFYAKRKSLKIQFFIKEEKTSFFLIKS